MAKVKSLPYDGVHLVRDELPEPNVQLCIDLEENEDSVGGGAAALGADGKWYWTFDGEITDDCRYKVKSWQYL
jgi:hypothetical protein